MPALINSSSPFPEPDPRLIRIAEDLKPKLNKTAMPALEVIEVERDDATILGWTKKHAEKQLHEIPPLTSGQQFIVDFGDHLVASRLDFDVAAISHDIEPADSPARIKLTFGEILNDVAESFEPYEGFLSKAWLPEETIVLQKPYVKPAPMAITNRYAFRYVKFEVISTSIRFGLRFSNIVATAVSSATRDPLPALTFSSAEAKSLSLLSTDFDLLRRIDTVAIATLRDCMQTVYEDGPRRDMRLWIGDLRLQALCAYATFKDYDLVKRCLYLFAAMPFNEEGLLCACAYEDPEPHTGGNSIVDYSLLFTNTLLDYIEASGDQETGHDLYAIAEKQFHLALRRVGEDFIYNVPVPKDLLGGGEWHFIDWNEELDKSTAFQCIVIFCTKALIKLASTLGKPEPVFAAPAYNAKLSEAIYAKAFDGKAFVSGPKKQLSWASNAFAVLAGVSKSKEEGQEALKAAYESAASIKGNTPYLHHYLCEAFIEADLPELALKHIKEYWGSMIQSGFDTFPEAWDPLKPRFSPYGSFASMSFCHAWSCTPALLLRRLGLE
ncbi:alpha-L-rhamnosidase [Leucosporidium creatinivorum]|uniref:Alpha-L-rhamnosidase n=1 Tax=Leucosporidium creatinivorum TaxID=106004 RepID=A0A1Y2DP54_9BASI|nr:alpha-L-rhamnosidase [Leucosporidium creatinivorum]